MSIHHHDERATVHHGDALEILRDLPDDSVDSVVTDPPYGLEFMGKDWDSFKAPTGGAGFQPLNIRGTGFTQLPNFRGHPNPTCRNCRGMQRGQDRPGFTRCRCDSPDFPNLAVKQQQAFGDWCQQWAAECLRVLKPGGHLLAFGGTRTYHRLACAVEDAGFEIRDSVAVMAWTYGSGFPKALDVSKAIDKTGGEAPAVQAKLLRDARERAGLSREQVAERVGCSPASVDTWEDGRSRAAGRDVEFITPSPEFRARLADLLGYTADERAIVGVDDRRAGDGTVYGFGHTGVRYGAASTEAAATWEGWKTALKPAFEPIVVARKPPRGTVADNVLQFGTGALNIDGCRTPAGQDYADKCASVVGIDSPRNKDAYGEWAGERTDSTRPAGRWPTNLVLVHHPDCTDTACEPGCHVAEMDRQTGTSTSKASGRGERHGAVYGRGNGPTGPDGVRGHDDEGGGSRFFPCFRYEPKASTAERPVVDGVAHPTVKPLALIRWLQRLVTRPGGTVLDLFAGSGTGVEAAILEGLQVVAIERDASYLPLIDERIRRAATAQPGQRLTAAKVKTHAGQLDLFTDMEGAA